MLLSGRTPCALRRRLPTDLLTLRPRKMEAPLAARIQTTRTCPTVLDMRRLLEKPSHKYYGCLVAPLGPAAVEHRA